MLLDNGHADPQTPQEWQEVADLANFYLALQASAAYGLVEHTFEVNEERCLALLHQAQERGYAPCPPEEVLKKVLG
jgi:hypothetical protein